jgi:hypothetical protein
LRNTVLIVLAGGYVAVADDRAPLPPYPTGQAPAVTPEAPKQITVTAAPERAPAPTQQPQTITLQVAAPAPPPQTLTLQVVAAPSSAPVQAETAAPTTVQAVHVKHPGPIKRAIGNLGERMARAKLTWVAIPTQTVSVQQTAALVVAKPAAVQAEFVAPTPQAQRKGLFGR